MWGGCEPSVGADAEVGEEENTGRRTVCSDVLLFRTFILRLLNAGFPLKPFRLPTVPTNLCSIYFGSLTICINTCDVPHFFDTDTQTTSSVRMCHFLIVLFFQVPDVQQNGVRVRGLLEGVCVCVTPFPRR